ncbi:intradiol ring-cleavage dioxygenase [Pseudonocardia dioxanivorans CB1190]|uniref:Intradiol ring-cleavage dioxygenase n=1 Tax=Pseudonocardia dioxanivorans (strain ATCC 55486 / DSM 44775 / JCM 13855 / CB1190) TaxID=675635 RepID=F4D140_PSEUX|nr:intradiol ring-cleavage dioxygenase [Pseudonocardia dioxanivorans]AEA26828.1 intradiol ring-cleavage dioxygenase [Pseudonocardia dioxanivorans CB1190]
MSDHDDFGGISRDLPRLLGRRRLLGLLAGGAAATLAAACTSGPAGSSSTGSSSTGLSSGASAAAGAGAIPAETGGPYPADGSNGPNVLDDAGIVRSDIRSSFGSSTTTAQGVPLRIELTLTDTAGAALPGAAVYVWHCDREGRYSLYSRGATGENYLRGVQAADPAGKVSFTSIFPACYQGRWPHVHFEVYRSLADATSSGNAVRTTQLALPKETCEAVYATDGYAASVRTLAQVSLASDMVFRDGWDRQLATVTGDVTSGFTASLPVVV